MSSEASLQQRQNAKGEEHIQLIVGLGNPGPQYNSTRHNAGAWFVEALANSHHVSFRQEKRFKSLLAECAIENQKVHLLLPQTYMNLSGDAVLAAAHFYKIPPQNILIAHDELDLPCGSVKLKLGGGDGGHNGLKDLIAKLHTKNFWRLRIGIHRPPELFQQGVSDYVLSRPSANEKKAMLEGIDNALSVTDLLAQGALEKAMQKLHSAKSGV